MVADLHFLSDSKFTFIPAQDQHEVGVLQRNRIERESIECLEGFIFASLSKREIRKIAGKREKAQVTTWDKDNKYATSVTYLGAGGMSVTAAVEGSDEYSAPKVRLVLGRREKYEGLGATSLSLDLKGDPDKEGVNETYKVEINYKAKQSNHTTLTIKNVDGVYSVELDGLSREIAIQELKQLFPSLKVGKLIKNLPGYPQTVAMQIRGRVFGR